MFLFYRTTIDSSPAAFEAPDNGAVFTLRGLYDHEAGA